MMRKGQQVRREVNLIKESRISEYVDDDRLHYAIEHNPRIMKDIGGTINKIVELDRMMIDVYGPKGVHRYWFPYIGKRGFSVREVDSRIDPNDPDLRPGPQENFFSVYVPADLEPATPYLEEFYDDMKHILIELTPREFAEQSAYWG